VLPIISFISPGGNIKANLTAEEGATGSAKSSDSSAVGDVEDSKSVAPRDGSLPSISFVYNRPEWTERRTNIAIRTVAQEFGNTPAWDGKLEQRSTFLWYVLSSFRYWYHREDVREAVLEGVNTSQQIIYITFLKCASRDYESHDIVNPFAPATCDPWSTLQGRRWPRRR
jgi:hypothetical protein